MRHENYMIALFNRNIINLGFPCLPWRREPIFGTPTQWAVDWGIFALMYTDGGLSQEVLRAKHDSETLDRLTLQLQRRMKIIGVGALLASPFIFLYLTVYMFFEYGRELRGQPTILGTRTWSVMAKWKLREFNELSHIFQKRCNIAIKPAHDYVNQFRNVYITIFSKFVVFIAGSLLLLLIVLGFIDDELINENFIGDRSGLLLIYTLY